MTTIRDIARAAQVSPSTVSFVLTNRPGVNPQTRRRVQAEIKRLGYQPRRVGRPSRPDGRQVAVVCGSKVEGSPLDSATAARMASQPWIHAMRHAVLDRGHHFNFFTGQRHLRDDVVLQQAVRNRDVDGVILVWQAAGDGYLTWLLEQQIPLVVINRRPEPGQSFSYVEMDNFGGSYQAAQWFVEHGHQRIATIVERSTYNYSRDRLAGFEAGLRDRGVKPVAVQTFKQKADVESACRAVMDANASAVFVGSDGLLCRCVTCWKAWGVQIPAQLSAIGFDNHRAERMADAWYPSSVGYDNQQLGKTAVHLLEYLFGHPQVGVMSAVIRTRVIEHDTTASYPTNLPAAGHEPS